jgi:hypothetical protein
VAQAAYDCNWHDTTLSLKRSLTMVMLRAQKPAALTAWKFFEVDLETFTTVSSVSHGTISYWHENMCYSFSENSASGLQARDARYW